jgi:putative two-component system response regulator
MTQPAKILVVDDTPQNVKLLADILTVEGFDVVTAASGEEALEKVEAESPDLILLDIMMPGMSGYDVCGRLKANSATKNIPVIFVTAMHEIEDETKGFELGAVDYIAKPIRRPIVMARVKTHLALYDQNRALEEKVEQRTTELRETLQELANSKDKLKEGYIDTILRLTTVAEYKDAQTSSHIKRVGEYCRLMANQMGFSEEESEIIYYAAPMHDIGKIGIPSEILLKTEKLTAEEFALMKTHTTIGGKILDGSVSAFIQMAQNIALTHHETYEGNGYPKGLRKDEIPLEGRIMNITDQYDALRSTRPYKPPFEHTKVFEIISEGDGRTMPEHFDPDVLETFKDNHKKFDEIYMCDSNLP